MISPEKPAERFNLTDRHPQGSLDTGPRSAANGAPQAGCSHRCVVAVSGQCGQRARVPSARPPPSIVSQFGRARKGRGRSQAPGQCRSQFGQPPGSEQFAVRSNPPSRRAQGAARAAPGPRTRPTHRGRGGRAGASHWGWGAGRQGGGAGAPQHLPPRPLPAPRPSRRLGLLPQRHIHPQPQRQQHRHEHAHVQRGAGVWVRGQRQRGPEV